MSQGASTLLNDDRASLIAFWVGPAQPFIAAAYSVRDLWLGSSILSWLTGRAMGPLLRDHGPEAFLTPAVKEGDPPLLARPNRYVAVIRDPSGGVEARRLADESARACRAAWKDELSDKVHDLLDRRVKQKIAPALAQDWDDLWEPQVSSYLHVETGALPLGPCDPGMLGTLLGKEWDPGRNDAAAWGRIELVLRLIDARKSAGHFPRYAIGPRDVPQKCTLLGSYEQMGPAGPPRASRDFWGQFADTVHPGGTHVRKRERLCAVSLVKRFAWAAHLGGDAGVHGDDEREDFFPDTATVAAARWLDEGEMRLDPVHEHGTHKKEGWSGQWLHWSKQDPEEGDDEKRVPDDVWAKILKKRKDRGRPPTYYAILAMDADKMHRWLQGEMAPGMGTELLTSLSNALARFAREICRGVVEDHQGRLIYAGGDDLLAFLPADVALDCAAKLAEEFARNWREDPGLRETPRPATLSGGIAVVHYKEDLRYALDQAREAEEFAKAHGGDAVAITVVRRSGEQSRVTIPWELVSDVGETFLRPFRRKASDRWLYALRASAPTLGALPRTAIRAEIGRMAARAAEEAKPRVDPVAAVDLWQVYRDTMEQRPSPPVAARTDRSELDDYLTLAQTMSFLTRGKD
jgi:CRISPR-associated protein Cmr2